MLVDIEYTSRKNNRLNRLIKNASFDQPQACIADINYRSGRKLDKNLIERLSTCEYISEKHNIIILGATGAGKSYMACALGMEACKHYYTVKYIRLPELLSDLAIARGEGIFKRVISQYKKYSLLILDEWMLISLTETEARDLLEIIHARHKRASTLFCSQFAPAGWCKKFAEATIADAILDRIVHDSYTVEIQYMDQEHDKSMREIYGIDGVNQK
jgi:DNA replication protein DnaC